MEVLNLIRFIRLFWGWIFPYIGRIHTAYIGEDSSILGTCWAGRTSEVEMQKFGT